MRTRRFRSAVNAATAAAGLVLSVSIIGITVWTGAAAAGGSDELAEPCPTATSEPTTSTSASPEPAPPEEDCAGTSVPSTTTEPDPEPSTTAPTAGVTKPPTTSTSRKFVKSGGSAMSNESARPANTTTRSADDAPSRTASSPTAVSASLVAAAQKRAAVPPGLWFPADAAVRPVSWQAGMLPPEAAPVSGIGILGEQDPARLSTATGHAMVRPAEPASGMPELIAAGMIAAVMALLVRRVAARERG